MIIHAAEDGLTKIKMILIEIQGGVSQLGNIKMGLQMKMKRGELIGFSGCLGYDYDKETKTITVNKTEAETVQLIFELYIQGYGGARIAKQLMEMGMKNHQGKVIWTDSGVMGVIKNEK